MGLICPVSVILRASLAPTHDFAKSNILMVRSAEPVANMSLVGSNAMERTQPRWEDMTVESCQGACHWGVGIDVFVNLVDFLTST